MIALGDALLRDEVAEGPRRGNAGLSSAPGPRAPVSVRKFGSSVLECPADYPRVADALRAEIAAGGKVVAVVSAMGGTTDALLAAARVVTPAPPHSLIGALLATGEDASVALLVLALAARGVRAEGMGASRLPVLTRGVLDDAEPVAVDTGQLRAALQRSDVVVFPGFVGVDVTGVPSLLGRGGSDLTALFLGHALGDAQVWPGEGRRRDLPGGPAHEPGRRGLQRDGMGRGAPRRGRDRAGQGGRLRGALPDAVPGCRVGGAGDLGGRSRVSGRVKGHRIPVAVLGATGVVGQRLVQLLDGHPGFRLAEVVASERRAGQRYGRSVQWMLGGSVPERGRAVGAAGSGGAVQQPCRALFRAVERGPRGRDRACG